MLKDCCDSILTQLSDVCNALDVERYSKELEILSGASIGMHYRHIIDFFDCLAKGIENGVIDYDERERNTQIEIDPAEAFLKIRDLKKWIEVQQSDIPVKLRSIMCEGNQVSQVDSSFNRELIYAIEHAIHHMAIIKIAFLNAYPEFQLDKNFGVAFSTLRYRETACAQ